MDTLLFIVSKMVGGLIRADTWIVLLSAVIAPERAMLSPDSRKKEGRNEISIW